MADVAVPQAEPSSVESTSFAPSGEARAQWLKTGELPATPPTQETAPADAPKVETPAAVETSKPQEKVTPEPGADEKPQEKSAANKVPFPPKKDVDGRIGQLTARQKEAEERAERAERELAAERAKTAKPEPAKAADEVKALDYSAFKAEWVGKNPEGTYDELSAAWATAVSENSLKLHVAEQAKTERESAQRREAEEATHAAQERHEAARTKYADFNDVAYNDKLPIASGSLVHAWTFLRPAGADVLYYLGKNPAELAQINAMSQFDATVALYEIERKVGGGEQPKAEEKPAPPAEKQTRAPKPTPDIGGRATAPEDALAAAAEADDFRSFKKEADRRDREKLRK